MKEQDDKPLRAVPDSSTQADPSDSAASDDLTDDTVEDSILLSAQEIEEELNDEVQTPGLTRRARFRKRGVYLLPNLITTGALFAGFYAIVAGMNGDFIAASLAIFVAFALDTADGRVARLTNTESQFGAEYDSLSDMVAFGVAPALVAFSWGLSSLGQFGWVATFVYMACAALRLARFNTKGDSAGFTGLASPSAAAIIACSIWVWVGYGGGVPSIGPAVGMAIITVVMGLLMVSNFAYFSPKHINFKGRVPFMTLVLVVMGFSVLLVDPPTVLLFLFTSYALSGPVQHIWKMARSGTKPA